MPFSQEHDYSPQVSPSQELQEMELAYRRHSSAMSEASISYQMFRLNTTTQNLSTHEKGHYALSALEAVHGYHVDDHTPKDTISAPSAMARTWYAGSQFAPRAPPSRKGKQAQPNQSVLSGNNFTVNDTACSSSAASTAAHETVPTEAMHSESESDEGITWVTPFSSPQKEQSTQPTINAMESLTQHPKLKDPPTAATFKPVGTMSPFAPSSSAPASVLHRAPTAQMVPLPPNAAVTTAAPEATNLGTSPPSHYPGGGPHPSSMSIANPRAFFPTTASTTTSLATPPIVPSTPAVPPKKRARKTSARKAPQLTLTPAPATAPSAFNDATLASHVENTKLLAPAKEQETTGVKKRKYVKKSSPLKSTWTPEAVPAEGPPPAKRGRPRTRPEEQQPLDQDGEYQPKEQHRKKTKQQQSVLQPPTPAPQVNPYLSATSASRQQQQRGINLDIDGAVTRAICAEDPRLWPGRGDYVAQLLAFASKPEPVHSDPVHLCTNHAAHQPFGHAVCTGCRNAAHRHIRATRPGLLGSAWWPLCEECGAEEMARIEPDRKGCSCCREWLCFSCQTVEIERRHARNMVEAEFRRRTIVREGMDRDVKTAFLGWACPCGQDIGPDATLLRCTGCQGLRVGRLDAQEAAPRENALRKAAMAWT